MTSPRGPGDFIYVVQAGLLPYFKIGITGDVAARVKGLQTGCPLPIQVRHAQKDGSLQIEQVLHRKLKPWQTCGEWYVATTESMEILKQEFGLSLEIRTLDETVLTQRLDRHRLDLQDAADRARTTLDTRARELGSLIEKAADMMAILTDQETVRKAFASKEAERHTSTSAASEASTNFEDFLARMFGRRGGGPPLVSPRADPIRPLPQQPRGRKRKT